MLELPELEIRSNKLINEDSIILSYNATKLYEAITEGLSKKYPELKDININVSSNLKIINGITTPTFMIYHNLRFFYESDIDVPCSELFDAVCDLIKEYCSSNKLEYELYKNRSYDEEVGGACHIITCHPTIGCGKGEVRFDNAICANENRICYIDIRAHNDFYYR